MLRILMAASAGLCLLLWPLNALIPPDTSSITLCFTGDIMGHGQQIRGALDPATGLYDYSNCFKPMSYLLQEADYTIGNFEVTLAGPPYSGYPCFSSPDALADALKRAGFDVLLTANNHQWDRGSKGFKRTLNRLDSLHFSRTGSFLHEADRELNGMVRLAQDGIEVGILNYTYGVNGNRVAAPCMINHIDTLQMGRDIARWRDDSLDKLVVVLHWGREYDHRPSDVQKRTADYLFRQGVDVIIGHHPHVLQPMEYHAATDSSKERLLVYSLGNFISNMRKRKCDGGSIFTLTFARQKDGVKLTEAGYDLHWTHRKDIEGRPHFEVLAVKDVMAGSRYAVDSTASSSMQQFVVHARALFDQHNVGVRER